MKNKKFKVLFLASWYPSEINPVSGIFIKKHAQAVAKYCDVAVLFVTSNSSLKGKLFEIEYSEENNIPTVRVFYNVNNRKRSVISNLFKFKRYYYILGGYLGYKVIKEKFGKPDIVHLNVAYPAGLIALFLHYFKGFPYILREHWDLYLKENKGMEKISLIKKLLIKLILKKAKCIIIDSNSMKNAMLELGIKNKFYVIPNIAEPETNNLDLENKIDKKSKKILLHISLLWDHQKNISGIIRAVSSIYFNLKRKDFELHVIGEGVDRKRLENFSKELGLLNNCIFFHGYLPDEEKIKFFKNANFHVLNSNFEGFSVVTAESLWHGVPVIATKCGGPEDFVTEDNGILIEPKNPKQLEDAIIYMLDNSDKYDRDKIKEYARNKFSYETIGEKTYNIYKNTFNTWNVGYCNEKILIEPDWLVLDVGSGHNPHPRANFLGDIELKESIHRCGKKCKTFEESPFIIFDAIKIPFKDKIFDYTIASHLAEHINDIEYFLIEIQRISKRGYIETPGLITELLLNVPYHVWFVFKINNKLIFRKKKIFKPVSNLFFSLFYLNENIYGCKTIHSNNLLLRKLKKVLNKLWKHIPLTYVKYHWEGEIKYKILK